MKKYIQILSLAIVAVSFASCLKDKNFDERRTGHDLTGVPKVIELAIAFNPANGRVVGLAFEDQVINQEVLTVRLAAESPATEDIKVTIDTTGAQAFINAFTPAVSKLPDAFYTMPSTGYVVTIPKGSREASIVIKTNAIQYNPSTTYGLYYTIKSVDKPGYVISGNFGSYFTRLGAKNAYDGIYKVIGGNVTRYTNPTTVENPSTLNGPLAGNPDVILSTVSGNSVAIPPSGSVGRLQWTTSSNSGVAGVDGIVVTINPTTFLATSISNGNPTFANWANKPNYYDPATKTMYLSFRWNPTANVREYEIVLRYDRSR